ncbi:Gpi16 subunit GPI transamidase component [Panus rudis PR-1116 ss-1]|nr:Gpi16 subunit GPI transamidase component [Panus rudis PR-1116 ss-1]
MKLQWQKAWLVVCLCWPFVFGATVEEFRESLIIRPLQDGKLASHFAFTTLLKGASPRDPSTLGQEDTSQHHTLFPLTLGQLLREYAVTELHLTLNAGKWNYDRWGYPDEAGVGTGAELWAWMGDSATHNVDERWKGLRNALSGLFCASLGSIDEQRTTSPTLTFRPEGSLPKWEREHLLRHGSLPSEHVCTENLTPFLKLLPCKSFTGIAHLLNPHRVFDADWHGLGIHVRYLENQGVEVRLSFQTVTDPVRHPGGKRDWSLRSVFDRSIDRSCPVARTSEVLVELPAQESVIVSPDPTVVRSGYATFDVSNVSEPLDIGMHWPQEAQFEYPVESSLVPLTHVSVQRTLKGSTQSRGRLSVSVTNNLPITIQASYLESMPWLLQFYLHSLEVHSNGVSRGMFCLSFQSTQMPYVLGQTLMQRSDDLVSIVSYTPPVPHSRPTLLQALLTLPAQSTVHLSMDVIKPFLRYTEHPPDAQRGWDLPPAVIIPLVPVNSSSLDDSTLEARGVIGRRNRHPHRVYTSILLVDLATPDFSMPYNVIIMSCTLIALIFGSVFNLLTRKFSILRVSGEKPPTVRPE